MKYSTIVIGDELLIGQVTDTNSGWIARHMSPLGWEAKSVNVIADDADEIFRAIDEAFAVTDVVLMTGGLGPTKDDITKATLCQYFGGEMVLNEDVKRNVDAQFKRRGIPMNRLTAGQAMVPSSCRVIQNEVGTAPIMWFERDGKVLVSMPGVPHEPSREARRLRETAARIHPPRLPAQPGHHQAATHRRAPRPTGHCRRHGAALAQAP